MIWRRRISDLARGSSYIRRTSKCARLVCLYIAVPTVHKLFRAGSTNPARYPIHPMASRGAAMSCIHNGCATHTQYQCWNVAQTQPWSFINMDRTQDLDYKHSYTQLCKWLNNSGLLPRYGVTLSYVRTQLHSGTVSHLCISALLSSTACELGKSKVYRKAYRNVTSHGSTLSLLGISPSPAQLPSCVLHFASMPTYKEKRKCTDRLLGGTHSMAGSVMPSKLWDFELQGEHKQEHAHSQVQLYRRWEDHCGKANPNPTVSITTHLIHFSIT